MISLSDIKSPSLSELLASSTPYEVEIPAYELQGCSIWSLEGTPVVVTPEEVDCANAHLLRGVLLAVCAESAVVVVDMAATTFCDAACINALIAAGKRQLNQGGELRLVVCDQFVRRVMDVLDVDQLCPTFASLTDAVGARHAECYDQAA